MGIIARCFEKRFLYLGILFLFGAMYGCASERNLVIRDNKLLNEGLYEISSLSADWELKTYKYNDYRNNSNLDRDFSYYSRCPDQYSIYIFRVWDFPGVLNKPKSFEEVTLYFFKKWYGGFKYEVNLLNVSKLELAGYDAAELVYITKEPMFDLCNDIGKKELTSIKSKWVLVKRYGSILGGRQKMILLWYASPVETYDKGIGEFDRFVQTFRLLKKD